MKARREIKKERIQICAVLNFDEGKKRLKKSYNT